MTYDLGPDFCVLERVPEFQPFARRLQLGEIAIAIIDLETTGLDYKNDQITEIGIIKFVYNKHASRAEVLNVYQEFNDPVVEISQQITKLTGITNEMVKNKSIDWSYVEKLLSKCQIIVCHNAAFDRKFLEQTKLGKLFEDKVFACSKSDVNWSVRGYGNTKLDYLNWKMGYFYHAHRAINDCWATLNILIKEEGALAELISHTDHEYKLYAIDTLYSAKDKLKAEGFFWCPGNNTEPKGWFIHHTGIEDMSHHHNVIKECGGSIKLITIPANRRYSSKQT